MNMCRSQDRNFSTAATVRVNCLGGTERVSDDDERLIFGE